ncbi:hypothetical protein PoB_005953200, partial [Plakobranchus ocellatus]
MSQYEHSANTDIVIITDEGGAVAHHLAGQLDNKLEVRGSNPSPSQINLSLLLRVHPAKVKAARKAMANYLMLSYAKNNQDPTPGSPSLGLR